MSEPGGMDGFQSYALLACAWGVIGEELYCESTGRFLTDVDVQKDSRTISGGHDLLVESL